MSKSSRVAVVTGGASGIGWAVVQRLAQDGWRTVIADIDDGLGQQRCQEAEPGSAVLFKRLDVVDRPSVHDAFESIAEAEGSLDVLVNSAGINILAPLELVEPKQWRRVMDVNLEGTLNCMQAAARFMLAAHSGSIINIASISAERGAPGRASYCVSKAGVVALTRVAAVEWAARGVRVNAVGPGYVDTPLVRQAVADGILDEPEITERIPLGRLAHPDEIASVIAFLASSGAAYINGQVIYADGGFLVDFGIPSHLGSGQ